MLDIQYTTIGIAVCLFTVILGMAEKSKKSSKKSKKSSKKKSKRVIKIDEKLFKKSVGKMNLTEYKAEVKKLFPEIETKEIEDDYKLYKILQIEFGLIVNKYKKRENRLDKVNETDHIVVLGVSDIPNIEYDDDGNVERVKKPFMSTMSAYFPKIDRIKKLNVRQNPNYERLNYKQLDECDIKIERSPNKNEEYGDYRWALKGENNKQIDSDKLQEILFRHRYYPEFLDEDDKDQYPIIVLYGTMGNISGLTDWDSDDPQTAKLLPLLTSKDGKREIPTLQFTLYNKGIAEQNEGGSNRTCYVQLVHGWSNLQMFQSAYTDFNKTIKNIIEKVSPDDDTAYTKTFELLTDLFSNINVLVVGTPTKVYYSDKSDRYTITFVATLVVETKLVPEKFPATLNDYLPYFRNRFIVDQPIEKKNSKKSNDNSMMDKIKATKEKNDLIKTEIKTLLEGALGIEADSDSLFGMIPIASETNKETFERMVENVRDKIITEQKKLEEDSDETPEEDSDETPEEDSDETPEEDSDETPKDEDLEKLLKKTKSKKAKLVIEYIYENDKGTGVPFDEILKIEEIAGDKTVLKRMLTSLIKQGSITEPKTKKYSIAY